MPLYKWLLEFNKHTWQNMSRKIGKIL
jgi:hypothetical protein